MKNHLTEKLLTAWREAERTADAAHALAEQARLTAEAAAAAAEAAREAAEGAGVNVERADVARDNARSAFHQRQEELLAQESTNPTPRPSGVAEPG